MRILIGAVLAFGLSASVAVSPATSAQWSEIPNTRFDAAKKADGTLLVPRGLPSGGMTDTPTAIISAWNSAALDIHVGRLLLVRHGGHADTAHNGVFALDLTTFRWSMLRDTSLRYVHIPSPAGTVYGPTYLDGSPASVHTYDCEEYLPTVRRVYSGGGIYWSPAGESVPQVVFTWNPATNEYERRAVRPGGYGCTSAWNAVTNRLVMHLSQNWVQYNPSTDTYEALSTSPPGDSARDRRCFSTRPRGRSIGSTSGPPGRPPASGCSISIISPRRSRPFSPRATRASRCSTAWAAPSSEGVLRPSDAPRTGLAARSTR
jgi:hypothetical protein